MADKVYVPEGDRLVCKNIEMPEDIDKCIHIGLRRLYFAPQIIDGVSKLCFRIESDENYIEDPCWWPIRDWGIPGDVYSWFETGWMTINSSSDYYIDLQNIFHLHPTNQERELNGIVLYELDDTVSDKRVLMFWNNSPEGTRHYCYPVAQVRLCDSGTPGVGIYANIWWHEYASGIEPDKIRYYYPFSFYLEAEAGYEGKHYKFLAFRMNMIINTGEAGWDD